MTVQSLQLLYQHPASRNLLLFVFFSTICSYNFHWYLTPRSVSYSKRIEWTQDHRALHLILTLGGLAGAGIFFYLLRDYWIAIAVGTFFTFLYSAPKLPQSLFR